MSREVRLCCQHCETELKRQLLGSNVFYYCKCCGRITSAKDMVTISINNGRVGTCV